MKTIGLIGGMSWESTLEYYRIINEAVRESLGGLHSAKIVMYSVNFAEIQQLQKEGKWNEIGIILVDIAQKIECFGADLLIISTNTMHKVANEVEKNISIPLLHIADATAERIIEHKITQVGLLGTIFTMEEDFYKKRLTDKYQINVIIPEKEERKIIHNIIFQELVLGQFKNSSREKVKNIINNLHLKGVEGIILGCTEIPLLIKQEDTNIPLFDTTIIHAEAAVKFSLK